MVFVDTNYFLRFLLKDIKDQAKIAEKLFEKGASGQLQLFTSTIVFFEIYWVLSSSYAKKKSQVIPMLFDVLSLNFIHFENDNLFSEAINLFKETNLSLVDSFNLVYAQTNQSSDFATFDKKVITNFKSLRQN